MGVPKARQEEEAGRIFEEIMVENVPNLIETSKKLSKLPRRINSKRSIPRYIVFKLLKDKENLESNKRSDSSYTRGPQ